MTDTYLPRVINYIVDIDRDRGSAYQILEKRSLNIPFVRSLGGGLKDWLVYLVIRIPVKKIIYCLGLILTFLLDLQSWVTAFMLRCWRFCRHRSSCSIDILLIFRILIIAMRNQCCV